MKPMFSRLFLVAFFAVAGLMRAYAQTTVTLPTIPCSTCNGPGAFATTAPACTAGLLGAPLTMSWGTAQGATTYTIMIATDANLSQNVATFTQTGTSISVPAYALKPSTTYYWTIIANSATGSTKATGSVCTFSTNTTWTGGSLTGGFPNGTPNNQRFNAGLAGGYYDCRSGDGTCASGDNLICNGTFEVLTQADLYVPNWIYHIYAGEYDLGLGAGGPSGWALVGGSVNLAATSGIGVPPSGTQRGAKLGAISGRSNYMVQQSLLEQNQTQGTQSFKVSFYGKSNGTPIAVTMPGVVSQVPASGSAALSTTWTKFDVTLDLAPSEIAHGISFSSVNGTAYITDVTMCKL